MLPYRAFHLRSFLGFYTAALLWFRWCKGVHCTALTVTNDTQDWIERTSITRLHGSSTLLPMWQWHGVICVTIQYNICIAICLLGVILYWFLHNLLSRSRYKPIYRSTAAGSFTSHYSLIVNEWSWQGFGFIKEVCHNSCRRVSTSQQRMQLLRHWFCVPLFLKKISSFSRICAVFWLQCHLRDLC